MPVTLVSHRHCITVLISIMICLASVPLSEGRVTLIWPLPGVFEQADPNTDTEWMFFQFPDLIILSLVPHTGQICVMFSAAALSFTPALCLINKNVFASVRRVLWKKLKWINELIYKILNCCICFNLYNQHKNVGHNSEVWLLLSSQNWVRPEPHPAMAFCVNPSCRHSGWYGLLSCSLNHCKAFITAFILCLSINLHRGWGKHRIRSILARSFGPATIDKTCMPPAWAGEN